MSRKHYNEIAAVIRAEMPDDYANLAGADDETWDDVIAHMSEAQYGRAIALANVAEGLCPVLAADNAGFDRRRFLNACGVPLR